MTRLRGVLVVLLAAPLAGATCGPAGQSEGSCPGESARVGIPCTNGVVIGQWSTVAMNLHLTMSAPLLAATEQVVVVVRERPADGSDVCADLWSPDFSKTVQGAGVVPKTDATHFAGDQRLVTPKPDGDYGILVYALGFKSAVLCEDASWCEEAGAAPVCGSVVGDVRICAPQQTSTTPVAAGCVIGSIVHGQPNAASVSLTAKP